MPDLSFLCKLSSNCLQPMTSHARPHISVQCWSDISEKFKYAESILGSGKLLTAYSLSCPSCRRMAMRQQPCRLSGFPINNKTMVHIGIMSIIENLLHNNWISSLVVTLPLKSYNKLHPLLPNLPFFYFFRNTETIIIEKKLQIITHQQLS